MKPGILIFITSFIVTGELFFLSKLAQPAQDIWQLLAQITGISGLFLLCWAYVFAVRHPILERMFGGLDKVYRWHHIIGGSAFIAIIHHPLLLLIRSLPRNAFALYFLPSGVTSYTLGIAAFYILLTLIVLTVFIDLPYRIWKQTHEWMGMVILLGAVHGFLVTSDVSRFAPLGWWIGMLSGVAIVSFLYKRFIYYWLDRGTIGSIRDIRWDRDIILVTLSQKDPNRPFPIFAPGQYAFLSFPDEHSRDEHPFSVVAQDHNSISFGIKVTGGFTAKMAQATNGKNIRIRGPYGSFGLRKPVVPHMLWIAGGIGVTPFIYLLRAIHPDQKLTFIVTARGDLPAILREPIEHLLSLLPASQLIRHDSIKSGRLTAEKIKTYTTITSDTYVWLCGPKPFMESLASELPVCGVKRQRIYFEDFTLR